MTFAYNHCDPAEKQVPLPIKIRELQQKNLVIHDCIERRVSVLTSGGQQVVLLLRTDSEHLAKFFAMNWPTNLSSRKPDATITALRESALSYGLTQEFDGSR